MASQLYIILLNNFVFLYCGYILLNESLTDENQYDFNFSPSVMNNFCRLQDNIFEVELWGQRVCTFNILIHPAISEWLYE